MYNVDRAPKNYNEASTVSIERSMFRIPQHIYKLAIKLLKTETKSDISKILKAFSSLLRSDPTLRDIFIFFGWSEENKNFIREIKYEEFIEKLEKEYEFSINELEEEQDNTLVSSNKVHGNNLSNFQNIPQIPVNNSNNSNLSLFNLNKNDDMFCVQKPIPLSNSQPAMQEQPLDLFLTNSAKVGWNGNSGVGDDESSLISSWQKNGSIKIVNKTPSMEENKEESGNLLRNSQGHTNNLQSVNPFMRSSFVNYKDYMSHLKPEKGAFTQNIHNIQNTQNNNASNPIYSGTFRPFASPSPGLHNYNSFTNFNNYNFPNSMPYGDSPGNVQSFPFSAGGVSLRAINNLQNPQIVNKTMNLNINVSNFKIDDIKETRESRLSDKKQKLNKTKVKKTNVISKKGKVKVILRAGKRKLKKNLNNNENEIELNNYKVVQKKFAKNKLGRRINNYLNLDPISGSNLKIKKISLKPSNKVSNKQKHTKSNESPPPNIKSKKLSSNHTRNSNFGLKEISKKVKEIVKKLKQATYKQISDVIVNEINEKDSKDEKNIRRRIYDSLNVMKAMNLFRKDTCNKYILWNGNAYLRGSNSNCYSESQIDEERDNLTGFSFSKQNKIKNCGYTQEMKSAEKENLTEMKNLIVKKNLKLFFSILNAMS